MSDGDDFEYGAIGAGEEEEMDGAIREEGAAGRTFDPTPYMRQLRGRGGQGQEYLDVKWRLLWLRREHPDAEIVTEHVRIDDGIAIFKATVTLPSGGKATGYGSETSGDFGDFIEKAETKAIGRALNALGYGAQFGERGEDDPVTPAPPARPRQPAPMPAPAPAPPRSEPPRPMDRPNSAAEAAESAAASASFTPPASPSLIRPEAETPPASIRPSAPTPIESRTAPGAERRARSEPSASSPTSGRPTPPRPAPPAAAGSGDEDGDLADVSWTVFWPWARTLGYRKREEVEAYIGRPIGDMTPGEVRAMIVERRGEGSESTES